MELFEPGNRRIILKGGMFDLQIRVGHAEAIQMSYKMIGQRSYRVAGSKIETDFAEPGL